jgi:hypothetical protein
MSTPPSPPSIISSTRSSSRGSRYSSGSDRSGSCVSSHTDVESEHKEAVHVFLPTGRWVDASALRNVCPSGSQRTLVGLCAASDENGGGFWILACGPPVGRGQVECLWLVHDSSNHSCSIWKLRQAEIWYISSQPAIEREWIPIKVQKILNMSLQWVSYTNVVRLTVLSCRYLDNPFSSLAHIRSSVPSCHHSHTLPLLLFLHLLSRMSPRFVPAPKRLARHSATINLEQ